MNNHTLVHLAQPSTTPGPRGRTSAQVCPSCGQPNQCAQQAGQPYTSCWCMQRPALGHDWLAQHLPRLNEGQQRCLCPTCHARLEQEKARADGSAAATLDVSLGENGT